MATTTQVTAEQAKAALAVLEAYGRQRFSPEYQAEQPKGKCVGAAVAGLMVVADEEDDIVEACAEMLEDINGHLSAFVVRGIEFKEAEYKVEPGKVTVSLTDTYAYLWREAQ